MKLKLLSPPAEQVVYFIAIQKEKPTHDRFTLNTSVSSSDLNVHIQLWQITDNLQMDKQKRPTM